MKEIIKDNNHNQIARVTVKKKKIVMLPEVLNYVHQPNRVTNAKYEFSLTQKKIFTAVLYGMQEAVKARSEGKTYEQLTLFKESDTNRIQIKIPLSDITKDNTYYDEVKQAAKALASIVIQLPGKDPFTGKTGMVYQGLMQVFVPDDSRYDKHLVISIDKEVSKRLIEIEKNEKGIPINYTRYAYEIIMQAKCKYTPRIYEIISSWKAKGGFTIAIEEFREMLMIGDKYPTYKNLKARVIKPAHDELYEKADCWFNCNSKEFEVRKGKTVTHLRFKVIVPQLKELHETKRLKIVEMLRHHFGFKENDFNSIKKILEDSDNYDKINYKLLELQDVIQNKKNTSDNINNVALYVTKAIINFFK